MSNVLDGIRVADFSWIGVGPISVRILCDYGAEVVRVESQTRIDGLRGAQPAPPGKSGYNVSGFFNNFNAGKSSFLLNMAHPRARQVAYRLIERSDVFVANYPPRVIENWGLTYDEIRAVKPDIVAAYLPMKGLEGPERDFAGYGLAVTGFSGLHHLSGFPNRPPFGVGTNYSDYVVGPLHMATAIMAGLRHRARTGQGQMIELAQVESAAAVLGPALLDYTVNGRNQERAGNRVTHMAPHGVFRCRDDARRYPPAPQQAPERQRWIAIAVRDDAEWRALCTVAAGQAFASEARFGTLLGRKTHEDALEQALSVWTRDQTAADLCVRLQAAGCPAGVVQDAEDTLDLDPHMRARGYYRLLDHAETGPAHYDGPIGILHRTPGAPAGPAPLFGEHTFQVATEVLEYTPDEVAELVAEQVLY